MVAHLTSAASFVRKFSPDKQLEILIIAAERTLGVDREELMSQTRAVEVVASRFMIWHTFIKNQDPTLGRRFLARKFNRTRTTILHGITTYPDIQKSSDSIKYTEEGFKASVREIVDELREFKKDLGGSPPKPDTVADGVQVGP